MYTKSVPAFTDRQMNCMDSKPRKRIELPWQVRLGSGRSGHVSSSHTILRDGPEPCWMDGAREVATVAQLLDQLFAGGRLERLELQIAGKMRCVVNCSDDTATVQVAPLKMGRARIPVAPSSSVSFEGLES